MGWVGGWVRGACRKFLCCGRPVLCTRGYRICRDILGFNSLDAISNLSPSAVTTKKVPRHCLMSPGGRTTLLERFGFVLISEIMCNHLLFYNLAAMPQSRYFYTCATEEETDAQMSHVLLLLNMQVTPSPWESPSLS